LPSKLRYPEQLSPPVQEESTGCTASKSPDGITRFSTKAMREEMPSADMRTISVLPFNKRTRSRAPVLSTTLFDPRQKNSELTVSGGTVATVVQVRPGSRNTQSLQSSGCPGWLAKALPSDTDNSRNSAILRCMALPSLSGRCGTGGLSHGRRARRPRLWRHGPQPREKYRSCKSTGSTEGRRRRNRPSPAAPRCRAAGVSQPHPPRA